MTIKRVRGINGAPDGQVSGWLYENAKPGTVLKVSQPAGDVVLDGSDRPIVLVSAGIGITRPPRSSRTFRAASPTSTVRLFRRHLVRPVTLSAPGLRRQVLAMNDARPRTGTSRVRTRLQRCTPREAVSWI